MTKQLLEILQKATTSTLNLLAVLNRQLMLPSIKKLSLSNIDLSEYDVSLVTTILDKIEPNDLKDVAIHSNHFSGQSFSDFLGKLEKFSLEVLYISCPNLSDQMSTSLIDFIGRQKNLKTIYLVCDDIQDKNLDKLCTFVQENISTTAFSISCKNKEANDDNTSSIKKLISSNQLKQFVLQLRSIDHQNSRVLGEILSQNKSLEYLGIRFEKTESPSLIEGGCENIKEKKFYFGLEVDVPTQTNFFSTGTTYPVHPILQQDELESFDGRRNY